MEKQQFVNRKWGYKILLSTAGSCFVMISQTTLLGQGYISITYCTIWGTQASSSLYVGTVTILLYFKTLTGFPVSKSLSALTTFTVNNICRRRENCWEGKPFVDIEGMLGILPGGGITIFWFGVVTELFVHGCPNTRKESSSSKPSKLNLPSCRNSVRIPRYSLICSDDGFN